MCHVDFINRCILILNAKIWRLLSVTKTKSHKKNRMLRSRELHELERVLFPRNRLPQTVTRAISILRRAVLPQFLGIARNCNCTCKDCAHFYRISYTWICMLHVDITYQIDYSDFCNLLYKLKDEKDFRLSSSFSLFFL